MRQGISTLNLNHNHKHTSAKNKKRRNFKVKNAKRLMMWKKKKSTSCLSKSIVYFFTTGRFSMALTEQYFFSYQIPVKKVHISFMTTG